MSLISVRDLDIRFRTDEGLITAVEDVSFDIAPGEVLGLVGESGSGKSVTAKSLMRLNGDNTVYGPKSSIRLTVDGKGIDVLALKRPRDMAPVRGGAISMIFQEPMASFAPALTVGKQMVEQLMIHTDMTKAQAKAHSIDMLDRVGIPAPDRRFDQYAFEFSGGMRQRAMIAMALSTSPKLLIADEPTTALDVTIQAQIMDLLRDLSERTGTALLFITHDLGVVAETCQRMITMYAGEIVEDAPVDDALRAPKHPYTSGLLRSLPHFNRERGQFAYIPGRVPAPNAMPRGCRFAARCPHAASACAEPQVLREIAPGRRVRCIRAEALDLDGAVERSPA
jgi:oligopeptide/dipeptide ABC transporter ATP-binding protein